MNIIDHFEQSPFTKVVIAFSKPLPDLRSVDGQRPLVPPFIGLWVAIFITDQTEYTIDLLFINNERHRVMPDLITRGVAMDYLKSLGILSADCTQFTRFGLNWREVIDLLDQAREFQEAPYNLETFVNTLDYMKHYPPEAYRDILPTRSPARLMDEITRGGGGVIEIVMNEYGEEEVEKILLGCILRHNRYQGQALAGHYRVKISEFTHLSDLVELFSHHFIRHLKFHLLILDLRIDPEAEYWISFLSTQLIPFLKEVSQEGRIIILNQNKERLPLGDLPVSVFLYNAGLA